MITFPHTPLALAFLLSEKLSAPLSALAESTRAIAKGDYSKLNPVKSRDEFGVLTQSFNTMTRQIAEATEAMERNQRQLENALWATNFYSYLWRPHCPDCGVEQQNQMPLFPEFGVKFQY